MNLRIEPNDSKSTIVLKLLYLVPLFPLAVVGFCIYNFFATFVGCLSVFRREWKEIHDRLLRIED